MNGGHTIQGIDDKLMSYLRLKLKDKRLTYSTVPTPVEGGYDTAIYRFHLEGASDELAEPLILRVFTGSSPSRATFESIVQGAFSDVGYPAPRVYFTCTDEAVLGAGFLIMELMPGRPMMDLPEEVIPEILAKAHLHLHGIDPLSIMAAFESSGFNISRLSFDSQIRWLRERVEGRDYDWLKNGLGWIEGNRPGEPDRLVICHGDFHPLNLLVKDGRVSGVLDWSGFFLWEKAYDVGATAFLGKVAAPALMPEIEWSRLVRRYLEIYMSRTALEPERVDYYSAFSCLRAMFEGVGGHLAWNHPEVRERLTDYFQEKTGVAIRRHS